jgi:hypothetical protein
MTIKTAADILRPLGIALTRDPQSKEFRVNFRRGREATAYYTNDLQDAVATGQDMARRGVR